MDSNGNFGLESAEFKAIHAKGVRGDTSGECVDAVKVELGVKSRGLNIGDLFA